MCASLSNLKIWLVIHLVMYLVAIDKVKTKYKIKMDREAKLHINTQPMEMHLHWYSLCLKTIQLDIKSTHQSTIKWKKTSNHSVLVLKESQGIGIIDLKYKL